MATSFTSAATSYYHLRNSCQSQSLRQAHQRSRSQEALEEQEEVDVGLHEAEEASRQEVEEVSVTAAVVAVAVVEAEVSLAAVASAEEAAEVLQEVAVEDTRS